MRYVLRVMRYALCVTRYALCVMCYALCVMRYALRVMRYALCVMRYALCVMRYALREIYPPHPPPELAPVALKPKPADGVAVDKEASHSAGLLLKAEQTTFNKLAESLLD